LTRNRNSVTNNNTDMVRNSVRYPPGSQGWTSRPDFRVPILSVPPFTKM
jgi:hypothetical protein